MVIPLYTNPDEFFFHLARSIGSDFLVPTYARTRNERIKSIWYPTNQGAFKCAHPVSLQSYIVRLLQTERYYPITHVQDNEIFINFEDGIMPLRYHHNTKLKKMIITRACNADSRPLDDLLG